MSEAQDRYLGRGQREACVAKAPLPNSRLESQMSRRDQMLKGLHDLTLRAEHVADKFCGNQPEAPGANSGATPVAQSVIGAIEQQNDWMESSLQRLDLALDRLQAL